MYVYTPNNIFCSLDAVRQSRNWALRVAVGRAVLAQALNHCYRCSLIRTALVQAWPLSHAAHASSISSFLLWAEQQCTRFPLQKNWSFLLPLAAHRYDEAFVCGVRVVAVRVWVPSALLGQVLPLAAAAVLLSACALLWSLPKTAAAVLTACASS